MTFRFALSSAVLALLALLVPSAAHAQETKDARPTYRADEFTDFVGLNASPFDTYLAEGPFKGAGTKYPPQTFFDLEIRHYRTGLFHDLVPADAPAKMLAAWKKYGAQPMLLIDHNKTKTAEDVLAKVKGFDRRIIGEIEGPNELNNKFPPQDLNLKYAGKTDEAAGAAFQTDVYRALKADSATKAIPVVQFTAIFTDYGLAKGCDGFDFANMHSYQGYDVPSSSLLMNETRTNNLLPVGGIIKPYVPTECGYNVEADVANGTLKTGSLKAQAKNLPMLLAEYFRHGVRRAYLFALHNADGYGLLESDQVTRRPSYYAVKNLLAQIKDSNWNPQTLRWEGGKNFAPRALRVSLGDAPPTVHTLTLQKQSGEWLLLVWNEVRNFDERAKKDIENAAAPVTLRLPNGLVPTVQVLTQNEAGSYDTRPATITNGSLRLGVPSSVMIVKLRSAPAPNVFKTAQLSARLTAPAQLTGRATENTVRLSWKPVPAPQVAGYFVYRNGDFVGATRGTTWEDLTPWIRPGLGYRWTVQAFDAQGNQGPKAEAVVQTTPKFPDLAITRFDLLPVKSGEPMRFKATLANVGDGATPMETGVAITFFVDGNYTTFGSTDGKPLAPGEQREIEATSNVTWTAGAHLVRAQVDDINRVSGERNEFNNEADRSLVVDVPTAGFLVGASDAAPGSIDLTREGTLDWIHFGANGKDSVTRKAGGGHQISDAGKIGNGYRDATSGGPVRVTWSDGDTMAKSDGTQASFWLNNVGSGYELSAPADTTERLLSTLR